MEVESLNAMGFKPVPLELEQVATNLSRNQFSILIDLDRENRGMLLNFNGYWHLGVSTPLLQDFFVKISSNCMQMNFWSCY